MSKDHTKQRRIAFTCDERSLEPVEQLQARGMRFHEITMRHDGQEKTVLVPETVTPHYCGPAGIITTRRYACCGVEAPQHDDARVRRAAWALVRHWRTIRGVQPGGLQSGTDVLVERLEAELRAGETGEEGAPC
jgi:hypothetical protein